MRLVLFLIVFTLTINAHSQTYPKDYFIPPLDIPLYLSGTFGELRSNHFHSGIDIKTQGVQGKRVYAIADGYVSRIKISTGGYGKALYITHPNGFVSVYGHLQKYNDTLQKFVKDLQYKRKSFSVESFPDKERFKVKKGDVIALSGNSGSSMGPHLHFEIREEATQFPVNPLFFESIKIKDFTRPQILGFGIYPVDEESTINGKNDTVFYNVEGWGPNCRLKGNPEIIINGNVNFGIKTHDLMNEISNKNGVYKISLFKDSIQVFGMKMDKLSFSTTRYINSLIDYRQYKEKGKRFVRTRIDTNNRLFIYNNVEGNGIYKFSDTLLHPMEFVVTDLYKNVSNLKFVIRSTDSLISHEKAQIKNTRYFSYSRKNKIEEEGISASFSANSFYRSFGFTFTIAEGGEDHFSKVYQLGDRFVPVQKSFTISIKLDNGFSDISSKIFIAYSPNDEDYWYVGAKRNGEFVSAKTRLLGYFTLMVDTVAPQIKPINIKDGKNIAKQKTIKMKIREKQTAISSYNAYLNDDWILMEYDAKNNLLVYNYDQHLRKGENNFRLIVIDAMKNKSEFEAELVY